MTFNLNSVSDTPYWKYFAFAVAVVATVGSQYFGRVMGLTPCELCWYQRIFMYPLVLIIGVGIYKHDKVGRYVLPLSILGFVTASYHNYLQVTPSMTGTCDSVVPCTAVLYRFMGLSIPMMSLIAFSLISIAFIYPFIKKG
ncbi:MAG: disulfide bond formation protein B [Halobacteria archaeon]